MSALAVRDEEQRAAGRLLTATIAVHGGLVELRGKRRSDGECRAAFYRDPREAADHATEAATGIDVYVGALPRARRGGSKADLPVAGRMCWADVDSAAAVAALERFPVAPTFVIESGGRDGDVAKRHAWWALAEPTELAAIEAINRRLVARLGADSAATDAARVLRPVGAVHVRAGRRTRMTAVGAQVSGRALAAALPQLPPTSPTVPTIRPDEPLRAIPATEYVPALTGRPVGRDGKVRCPFHDDRTPSMHCYDEPGRGHYCFGCGAGGDVFSLVARLHGLDARRDFPEVRRRAHDRLGVEGPVWTE